MTSMELLVRLRSTLKYDVRAALRSGVMLTIVLRGPDGLSSSLGSPRVLSRPTEGTAHLALAATPDTAPRSARRPRLTHRLAEMAGLAQDLALRQLGQEALQRDAPQL